jgi:hypothetical protein
MKSSAWMTGVLLCLGAAGSAKADDNNEAQFRPLFNGRDLAGWVNVNCAPGTFYVKDKEIITTGKPTGYLRTAKQYENFVAEFEWMHVPSARDAVGNSGFFVWADPLPAVGSGYTRGIEVQVLVNLTYKDPKTGALGATSQGDLFSIWGARCVPERPHPLGWARCLPAEDRCKGAGEWNHYRVTANDGVIKLAVNGKVVSGVSHCNPRKGYLALESEGSECHFRNLRIQELASTHPQPNEVADLARGHQSLYSGLDLSGWVVDAEAKKHWQPRDTVLHHDGPGEANKGHGLRTEKDYGDVEFVVDFRFPAKNPQPCTFALRRHDKDYLTFTVSADNKTALEWRTTARSLTTSSCQVLKPAGQWNRLVATVGTQGFTASINNQLAASQGKSNVDFPPKGTFGLEPQGAMDFANLFVREGK